MTERLATEHGSISFALDRAERSHATVVLAPGAGADMTHPFMATVARGLVERGFDVVRFNFVYQDAGRKAPDKQPVLEATYRAILDHLGDRAPIVIGGKSMGGRIASHVAASGADVSGLLFLGFPLHPPGRPDRMRDAHLHEVKAPMLFVEGTRDPFCPLATLERVRDELTAATEVAVIDDGDHSFKVPRASGRSTEEAWQEVIGAAAEWLMRVSAAG